MNSQTSTRRTVLKAVAGGAGVSTITKLGAARRKKSGTVVYVDINYELSSTQSIDADVEKRTVDPLPYHAIRENTLYLNSQLMPKRVAKKFGRSEALAWDGGYHKIPGRIAGSSIHLLDTEGKGPSNTGRFVSGGVDVPEFTLTVRKEGTLSVSGLGRQPVEVEPRAKQTVRLSRTEASVKARPQRENPSVEVEPIVTLDNYGQLELRDVGAQ